MKYDVIRDKMYVCFYLGNDTKSICYNDNLKNGKIGSSKVLLLAQYEMNGSLVDTLKDLNSCLELPFTGHSP